MTTLIRARFGGIVVRMKVRGAIAIAVGDRVQREYGGEVGVVIEVICRLPR